MHSYPRHLGDYAKDTGHLSALEHGCYTLLTDWYYASEKPIPATKAHRICKASTKQERQAVDSVLTEFFKRDGDDWRHKRIDAEVEKCRELVEQANGKRENEKERQHRHRERRKALFDALRQHNEVPPYDTCTTDLEALLSRVTERDKKRDVDASVTRTATANQEPRANSQEPNISNPWPGLTTLNGIDFSGWPSLPTKETMQQWLKVRKTKRATNSQIAMDDVCAQLHEAAAAGCSADDCIKLAVVKSWSGFKWSWAMNEARDDGYGAQLQQTLADKASDRSWAEA